MKTSLSRNWRRIDSRFEYYSDFGMFLKFSHLWRHHDVNKVNSPLVLFSKEPLKTSPASWNTPLAVDCHQLDVGRPAEVHFGKEFCHRKYAQIDSELYSIQIRARGLLEILHIRVFSVLIVTQMALCFCFQFALDDLKVKVLNIWW